MRTRFQAFLAMLLLVVAGLPASISAQENVVVVELYTSQGCSSCPPADALLIELVERPDVLALALHVDYWDYLGWKDIFGNPAFTIRQQGYARVAGSRTIYTPQFVVGGENLIVGAKGMELANTIRNRLDDLAPISIGLSRSGNMLEISVDAVPAADQQDMMVQLVRYLPEQSVGIRRGENAGRLISYVNIVTEWQELGRWHGATPLSMTATVTGTDQVAVIVQNVRYGPILAAAALR